MRTSGTFVCLRKRSYILKKRQPSSPRIRDEICLYSESSRSISSQPAVSGLGRGQESVLCLAEASREPTCPRESAAGGSHQGCALPESPDLWKPTNPYRPSSSKTDVWQISHGSTDARHGIVSRHKRTYKATTNSKHVHPVAPNSLNRQVTVVKPNRNWVSDITSIPLKRGGCLWP